MKDIDVPARIRRTIAYLLPPIASDGLRALRARLRRGSRPPEWERVADDDRAWTRPAGWSHSSIAAEQRRKWPEFLIAVSAPKPVGVAHEGEPGVAPDLAQHNLIMSFGYVLGRAAEGRTSLRVLDWGGGIGHYYALARALLPELTLDYTVKDTPELCAVGRVLNPGCRFVDADDAALTGDYDLVFASCSIHYTRDVYGLLRRLCGVARRWLLITRHPIVLRHDDFVVVQRPHAYGYLTEYAGWFMNRDRFLNEVLSQGFRLDREFLLDERPYVHNAPEQCRYAGFLFARADGRTA